MGDGQNLKAKMWRTAWGHSDSPLPHSLLPSLPPANPLAEGQLQWLSQRANALLANGMKLTDNQLVVPLDGLYLIYSQVLFKGQGCPQTHVLLTPCDLHSRSLCHTLLGPNWKTIFAGLLYNVRALTVLFSENKAPQRHLLESKPVGGFSQNPGQGSRSAWYRGPQRRSRAGRAPSLQPRPGLGVRGPPGFLRGMDQSGGALCLLGSPTERWRLE